MAKKNNGWLYAVGLGVLAFGAFWLMSGAQLFKKNDGGDENQNTAQQGWHDFWNWMGQQTDQPWLGPLADAGLVTGGNMAQGIGEGSLWNIAQLPGEAWSILKNTWDGATGEKDPTTASNTAINSLWDFGNNLLVATGQPFWVQLGYDVFRLSPYQAFAENVTSGWANTIKNVGTSVDDFIGDASCTVNGFTKFLGISIGTCPLKNVTGVAPLEDGTVSIMPVDDTMLKSPYDYDQSKLPLDPNGQPYLPPDYGLIENKDFTSSGGQSNVTIANLLWSTPAVYNPNIGSMADANPLRYIPALTPEGFPTSQGYYDTVDHHFESAFGDSSIKTFNDVNTWKDNPINDTQPNVIPGFNAPMDNAISLPAQDQNNYTGPSVSTPEKTCMNTMAGYICW